MQAQAGQGLQLLPCPLNALGQKTFAGFRHGVRIVLAADTPQQALGLQARAGTGRARRVAAVLGQQHPDMHLVGLGLQVLEEAFDAEPVLVPLAVPVGRAVDNPVLVLGLELVPGRVARNAGVLGMAHQVVLGFLPGRSLHWFDGTRAQG